MCVKESERASETALSKEQKSAEWMAARPPINCVPSRLLLAHTHRHARTTRRGGDGGCALKIIRENRLAITTCPWGAVNDTYFRDPHDCSSSTAAAGEERRWAARRLPARLLLSPDKITANAYARPLQTHKCRPPLCELKKRRS